MVERLAWGRGVTYGTGVDGAGVSLERDGLHVVLGINRGRDRVGASMAGLTTYAMVAFRIAEQRIGLFVLMTADEMAVVAAGLVLPGPPCRIADLRHGAVAVRAGHAIDEMDVPQALRLDPGMAGVAVVRELGLGHTRSMCRVHGTRQRWDARDSWKAEFGLGVAGAAGDRLLRLERGTVHLIMLA